MADIKRTHQLSAGETVTLPTNHKAEMFVVRDGTVTLDTLEFVGGSSDTTLVSKTLIQDQDYWSIGWHKFTVNSGSAGKIVIFEQA